LLAFFNRLLVEVRWAFRRSTHLCRSMCVRRNLQTAGGCALVATVARQCAARVLYSIWRGRSPVFAGTLA